MLFHYNLLDNIFYVKISIPEITQLIVFRLHFVLLFFFALEKTKIKSHVHRAIASHFHLDFFIQIVIFRWIISNLHRHHRYHTAIFWRTLKIPFAIHTVEKERKQTI